MFERADDTAQQADEDRQTPGVGALEHAARLGLVRLVTGDRRPPLVFDDPFVTFDDERAARTMALLKSLTSDFQVIYLTMSSRYDDVADAVIELPPPIPHDGHEEEGLHHLTAAGERQGRLGRIRR